MSTLIWTRFTYRQSFDRFLKIIPQTDYKPVAATVAETAADINNMKDR